MRTILVSLALAVLACYASGEEKAAESRVISVGLFKNGLAVVKRSVSLPETGTYWLDDVPEPVHGTFWIESDAVVEARVTMREIEVPLRDKSRLSFQEELAGKQVVLHFRDGSIPPATGRVVKIEPPRGEDAWNRSYRQPNYSHGWSSSTHPPKGRFLILRTAKGRIYVDSSMIAYAEVQDEGDTAIERRPVLLLDVKKTKKKPATVVITYLTKGLSWAPSYRVDISNHERLTIEQKAIVRNELHDIENADIYLISGFPSVQFAHVTSPLSLRTTWAEFFQQLNQRVQPGQGLSHAVTQRAVEFNAPPPDMALDMSAIPTGEGPDIHYEPTGKRSLAEGASLSFSVASGAGDYERIVEWIVPDTRRADGRHIQEYERREHPEKYQDEAWDAVRFKNPLPFPMTTAPAMIMSGDRFHGQRMSYWVNIGEETTLHITKALSIRTRSEEHEEQGERSIVYVGGNDFRRTTVKGQLTISNHREENVKLVVRRRFSGDLLETIGNPECTLREEGVWSVNKRNELTWTLDLGPGAQETLTYRYSVLVDN